MHILFPVCDSLSDFNNGSVIVTPGISGNWSYDAIAEFSCITGYVLSHNGSLRCVQNGFGTANWNDTVPTCEIQDCNDLHQPTNGTIELNGTTYLSVVRYTCDLGFYLNGPEHRKCLPSGKWSATAPTCNAIRKRIINGISFKTIS